MSKRESIAEAKLLFEELNNIICAWDPYGLSKAGEISGEFSDEVWEILCRLPHTDGVNDVIDAVQGVFGRTFGDLDFSFEHCRAVGEEIFKWWSSRA